MTAPGVPRKEEPPVLLAALAGGEPLLLVGPHGTGKSYLLARLCAALDLEWRHYNASLLNFDDLVGYPLPDGRGGLDYVRTPATVWDAEAVFLDEISRCRPDMQNKLFPIVHERRVQGLPLERLVYRWAAMNPPSRDDDPADAGYLGSEPLDTALADRFAFVVEVPGWRSFSEADQERVILLADAPPCPRAAARLRRAVGDARGLLPALRDALAPRLAVYVRLVAGLLGTAGLPLSGRRAGILLRNVLAVHAARHALDAGAALEESALLALTHSLPQRATGEPVKPVALLAAHREAWRLAALDADDPRRLLQAETDPVRRALRGLRVATLSRCLEAALWAFHTTGDFREGALAAVNLGEDADTTGAVYGQIAGAHYGVAANPDQWLAVLHDRERIRGLARALHDAAWPAGAAS